LSARAFHVYGSYRDVIRGWFETGLTTTLVAAVRGRPAGFVMAAPLTPQPFPGTEILAIAVEPHSRQLGIGRSLLAGVEKALFQKGCRRLWLHTAVVNQPARRMFEAAGFAPAEAKKAFYPSGHDALLMIKVLGSAAP
jgi:ribosomal-protein-alanine N-acetyltransferase